MSELEKFLSEMAVHYKEDAHIEKLLRIVGVMANTLDGIRKQNYRIDLAQTLVDITEASSEALSEADKIAGGG